MVTPKQLQIVGHAVHDRKSSKTCTTVMKYERLKP